MPPPAARSFVATLGSVAVLAACAVVVSCGAPERRPPADGPDTVRHRPPPDEPGTGKSGPPHDPFTGTAESHVPAGAECGADSDCTLQSYPDPAKDGCCPHWCGRPVTSVARAKELEKLYAASCHVDCPPYDCAALLEPTPRCDAGRCVAVAAPRPGR
jgi:hypothetical protein